jgi:hypothetical protein
MEAQGMAEKPFRKGSAVPVRLDRNGAKGKKHSGAGEFLIRIKNAVECFRARLSETEQNGVRRSARNEPAETSSSETAMPTQTGSVHFFLSWAKERIDEMDATLASLESKAVEMQAQTRVKADQFLAQMRTKRDEFESIVKKQAEAGEPGWDSAKQRLAAELKAFEAETRKYLENFGNGIEQQQAVFQSQVAAQLNAWHGAADKLNAAAKEFAIERRREIDATVSRMKADAAAAEKKLQELARAGTESWSTLNAALAETRATFDRANQATREAFKRAIGSAQ